MRKIILASVYLIFILTTSFAQEREESSEDLLSVVAHPTFEGSLTFNLHKGLHFYEEQNMGNIEFYIGYERIDEVTFLQIAGENQWAENLRSALEINSTIRKKAVVGQSLLSVLG